MGHLLVFHIYVGLTENKVSPNHYMVYECSSLCCPLNMPSWRVFRRVLRYNPFLFATPSYRLVGFLGLAIAKQKIPLFFLTIYRLFSLPLCSKWLSVVFFAIHFMAGAMTEDKVTRGRPPATEMKHGRSDPKMPLFHQANIGFWGLEFWWILGMTCM